jgi:hypothetical protein
VTLKTYPALNTAITPVLTMAERFPHLQPVERPDRRGHAVALTPNQVYESINAGCAPKGAIDRPRHSREASNLIAVRKAQGAGTARDGGAAAVITVQHAALSELVLTLSAQVANLSARVDVLDGASCDAASDLE